jgi:hypothetical protein
MEAEVTGICYVVGMFLGIFGTLQKAAVNFVLSACLTMWNNLSPAGWSLMKFDI